MIKPHKNSDLYLSQLPIIPGVKMWAAQNGKAWKYATYLYKRKPKCYGNYWFTLNRKTGENNTLPVVWPFKYVEPFDRIPSRTLAYYNGKSWKLIEYKIKRKKKKESNKINTRKRY